MQKVILLLMYSPDIDDDHSNTMLPTATYAEVNGEQLARIYCPCVELIATPSHWVPVLQVFLIHLDIFEAALALAFPLLTLEYTLVYPSQSRSSF